MNEQKKPNNADNDKESIQQQPAQEKQQGIYTPEPPQVKDPSRLPDSENASEEEQGESDDQQADSSQDRKG